MRQTSVILLFFVMISSLIYAQDEEQDLVIGFACSEAGTETSSVIRIRDLLVEGRYSEIGSLLESSNPAEQFVAVITITRLVEKKKYKLSDEERQHVAEIKSSEMIVWACEGSTFWEKRPLKKLFVDFPDFGEWWLDKNVK